MKANFSSLALVALAAGAFLFPDSASGQVFTNATKLRNRNICATAPTDAQALAWSASLKCWTPADVTGGGVDTDTPTPPDSAVWLARDTGAQGIDNTIVLTSSSPTAFVGAPAGNAAPANVEGTRWLVLSNANCASGLTLDIGNGQSGSPFNVYQLDGTSPPNTAQCASGQAFWVEYSAALHAGLGGYRIISGGNGFFGTATMPTTALGAGLCASVVVVSAPGVKATDTVTASANASIKALAGYTPGGGITINAYATADNVNFDQCNALTSTSPTLGAVTLNWRVAR